MSVAIWETFALPAKSFGDAMSTTFFTGFTLNSITDFRTRMRRCVAQSLALALPPTSIQGRRGEKTLTPVRLLRI